MEKSLMEQFKAELANDILLDRGAIRKMLSEKQQNGEIEYGKDISRMLSSFVCTSEKAKAAFFEEFDKFFGVFMFNLYGRMLVTDDKFKQVIQNIDIKTVESLKKDFEKIRPGTFEKIKTSHIDFNKFIQDLDDRCVQVLLNSVDSQIWVPALKGSAKKTLNKILGNMSKRAGRMLCEDLEFCGPIREGDVLIARWKVIKKFIALQEEGKIVVNKTHPFSDDLNLHGVGNDAKNKSKDKLVY